MPKKTLTYLTHLLTLLGLSLMLVGGSMWWRQSRLEAALLSQDERVLLAVSSAEQPGLLPAFEEAAAPDPGPSATPPPPSATPEPSVTGTLAPPATDATATPEPTPTPDSWPVANAVPSRVVVPAIGLDAEVVEMGWDTHTDANGNSYSEWVVPAWAAGWHKNSLLPGHGGNVVLSGHHNVDGEVFRRVVDLEPGNEIMLDVEGVIYRYIVEEKYIVAEKGQPIEVRLENNRYIEPTDDERLTLVTCWPYETNTHRVVVIGRPVAEATPEPTGEPAGG